MYKDGITGKTRATESDGGQARRKTTAIKLMTRTKDVFEGYLGQEVTRLDKRTAFLLQMTFYPIKQTFPARDSCSLWVSPEEKLVQG